MQDGSNLLSQEHQHYKINNLAYIEGLVHEFVWKFENLCHYAACDLDATRNKQTHGSYVPTSDPNFIDKQ